MPYPNYEDPGGFREAAKSEFTRLIDTFGTLEYVPQSKVDAAITKYGAIMPSSCRWSLPSRRS